MAKTIQVKLKQFRREKRHKKNYSEMIVLEMIVLQR